ncbi:MAG TPA: sigma-54 dependent transcriptional regulator [Burkholderiales bacterium]|nr:sigma-54 dependent transcriptional regulator [Burkholderiales bacterium]
MPPINERASQAGLKRHGLLYGSSPAMQKLYGLIDKVAPTDTTVLIAGESGTGKELVANSIHRLSARRGNAFVPINCGAIPSNLIEAELFGHERGSFTGAVRTHKGYFERAAGGTLFLDEITEMPVEMQVKLLRVLETGGFYRVGGDQEIKARARVIAATNQRPEAAVENGRLREDLWYRLSVFPIEVPPLRKRGEDIELLARHFLDGLNLESGTDKTLSASTLSLLRAYPWPGNVRELQNALQRAFIMADHEVEIGCSRAVSLELREHLNFRVGTPLAEVEREMILATLSHQRGNKRKAAEALGVSLKTLYNRLNEYLVHESGELHDQSPDCR